MRVEEAEGEKEAELVERAALAETTRKGLGGAAIAVADPATPVSTHSVRSWSRVRSPGTRSRRSCGADAVAAVLTPTARVESREGRH